MIMIIENKRGGGFDRQSSGDPDRTEGNWRSAPKSFDGMYQGCKNFWNSILEYSEDTSTF
jgi:hypothetical protein